MSDVRVEDLVHHRIGGRVRLAANVPDVRTSLAFYRGRVKIYETPIVQRENVDDPSRHAAVFQLEVPASSLAPGFYTCQVNIIDSVAGKFAFPRVVFLVR